MMKKVDILLTNAEFVITMDPERRIITNGAVAIDQGAILEVDKSSKITKKYEGKKVIDAYRGM